jgi:hypothetical protein
MSEGLHIKCTLRNKNHFFQIIKVDFSFVEILDYRRLVTILDYRRLVTILDYRRLVTNLDYRRLVTNLDYHRLVTILDYRRLVTININFAEKLYFSLQY